MPTFTTDVWIDFTEDEIPDNQIARAEEIAHELGADETVHYGNLRVKYEGSDLSLAQPYADAIISRLRDEYPDIGATT